MCGIGGICVPGGGAVGGPGARERMGAWLDLLGRALRHRGPDASGRHVGGGSVGLLCERLAVVDVRGGHQPVAGRAGTVQTVLNGEIYNHAELRRLLAAKGHVFRTAGDTEVLSRAYEEYGTGLLEKLNGMFAFAIWDERADQLFLARDRFGIKPLYYLWHDGKLAFASEIKALCRLPWYRPALNPSALVDYTAFQYTLGDHTFFDKVRQLPPGHTLTFRRSTGDLRVERYWEPNLDDDRMDFGRSAEDFTADLADLVGDCVRAHLSGDVDIGAHVSGGLDSSTVAVLASKAKSGPLHAFSGGFAVPGFDERPYARAVARHIGAVHHEVVPGEEDLVTLLPRLVRHLDEPTGGPGVFPQYLVSRLAAGHVKVVLGGLGGDELGGGYVRYYAALFESALRAAVEGSDNGTDPPLDVLSRSVGQLNGYQPMLRHLWARGLFEDDASRYFRLVSRADPEDTLEPDFLKAADRNPFDAFADVFSRPRTTSLLHRMLYVDSQGMLPSLLQVEDRVAMAVSLESRLPLLDHRIAELLASAPPSVKLADGRLKHLLRSALSPLLPAEVAARKDKMGFPVPLGPWSAGRFGEFARDVLTSERARGRGVYKPAHLRRVLAGPSTFGRELWGPLCVELWFRAFIDADGAG